MNSKNFDDFIASLAKNHFAGMPVLLAGSYASNTQSTDSDVDLMVFTEKVNHPEISGKVIEGYTVELIEMPYHNPISYLEKTMANSGAYITMLNNGKIVQDEGDYLHTIKAWAQGVYEIGPPAEGRKRKMYRNLIEVTHLLKDLEGNKPALEKFFAANHVIIGLNNLHFLGHNLWPMGGKWATRTLDSIYPDYTKKLSLSLNKGIAGGEFADLVHLIDGYLEGYGGRIGSYNTTMKQHVQPEEHEAIQVVAPGLYFAESDAESVARIMDLAGKYPDMYLKPFDEGQGSLGVVIPNPELNDTLPFETLKGATAGGPVVYSMEPPMYFIYGGKEAKPLAESYFNLVTQLAVTLKGQITDQESWHKLVLSQMAYLFPVFCVQMSIRPEQVSSFATYLYNSWYPEAINTHGYLSPNDWLAEKEKLQQEVQLKADATDPDLIALTKAIMEDKAIRFDVGMFDMWADGLNSVSDELYKLAEEGKLYTYSLHRRDIKGVWPVLKNYLDFLYTLLDVPLKDRLYLVLVLKKACELFH